MKILKIDPTKPHPFPIAQAARVLKSGGVVIYPTDTAYGVGVDATNINCIEKLYQIKGRNILKPTHVIVRDWKMIEKVAHINKLAKILYEKFMPGPITLILFKKNVFPNKLTANLTTIGVRIPNCKVTQQLSLAVAFPYTTPSEKKEGDQILQSLDSGHIDLVLDAGILPFAKPSTMVDLTQDRINILRDGPISKEEIVTAIAGQQNWKLQS